jgi:hypothetical protein
MNSYNPLRRSPLKPKPRQRKESMPWRRPKIRLDAKGMLELRQNAFARSEGQCENSVTPQRDRCPVRIYWGTGQLAHMVSRGRGGNDSLENCLMVCRDCHYEDTRNRKKLEPHKDWMPKAA